ncbi:heavy metal sensor histidine kinase [Nitrogeniibacter mangrovi]|uniref:Sensor protein n=1 Tax=Nitrogeniibacter mangrovi TaxID=2016596 RepID=A0A6C1B2N9_9RHOO|nr:heavy metal sensor histidine kinase [Nitrogeniibacter mangrovi]QID17911.1 heavy metal sensor histidine kinase [Nitrogeniibacter mangrovi]
MSKRPFRYSLTTRLTIFFALVSCGVIAALGMFMINVVGKHFVELDRDELQGKIMLVENVVSRVDSAAALAMLGDRLRDAFVGHRDLVVMALGPDGLPLLATPGVHFPLERLRRHTTPRSAETFDWREKGVAYRGLAAALDTRLPDTGPIVVAVAIDIRHHALFLERFKASLLAFSLFAAAVSGVLGWGVARRGLAPLRDMSERASAVTPTRLDRRLPEESFPVELAHLAHTLNDMFERLEDAFRRLSNFSSDLAHELRTPISNLMTQTQVALAQRRDADAYRETLASNAEEFERLAKMVSDMLFLAKAEHGLMLPSISAVRVENEVSELFEFYDALAETRGVRLHASGQGCFNGDRLMVRRALSNLLSNALRHTPSGGRIDVAVEPSQDGVVVRIDNTGTPIAPADIPHLFDRFYRADKARRHGAVEGSGLGLAITRAIAIAHGGDISVSSDAQRTRFSVRFASQQATASGD